MLYFLNNKKDCTACTACVNVCPVNCISMIQDKEGFEYPVADEKCIHCKKCENICPIENKRTEGFIDINQFAVAAVTNDYSIWKSSTSGGAFTEICNSFGGDETVVFGAKFEGFKVVHDYVVGINNIQVFRKSKYIQSSLLNSFVLAKDFLEQGKQIIFSGTPCQIAGLKSFLNKEYDNLLTIDLICHGVGSPKVFNSVVEYYGRKYGSKIIEYSFRNRRILFGNQRLFISKHRLENGKTYHINRDIYNDFFLNQLCLRPSCGGNCKFRSINRTSDITIADFKNKSDIFPKLRDSKNYSTIIVNSIKGSIVYNGLHKTMTIFPCDLEDIKKYNPLFCKHTKGNPLRNEFFKDYIEEEEIDLLVNKYLSKREPKIKQICKDILPHRFKVWYHSLQSRGINTK
jgi:coenzyme F420-reducing hydrogenase beta subunit